MPPSPPTDPARSISPSAPQRILYDSRLQVFDSQPAIWRKDRDSFCASLRKRYAMTNLRVLIPAFLTKKAVNQRFTAFFAERQGFEPWVPVRVQRFSRPSRSTTPASFQWSVMCDPARLMEGRMPNAVTKLQKFFVMSQFLDDIFRQKDRKTVERGGAGEEIGEGLRFGFMV